LGICVAAYAALVWRFWYVCDDAFISFRFARNWTRGFGLRFNPTEVTPVEGFTNFLWVAVCAVLERVALDVTLWAPVLSAACGVALLLRVWRTLTVELRLDPLAAFLAALALACFPPFALWSTSGLETMPFALCVYLGFEQLTRRSGVRRPAWTAIAAAAIVLMRADGIFWALALTGCVWIGEARVGRGDRRTLVIFAAAALATIGLYAAWRYAYFGDLVPNTARAKVGLSVLSMQRGVAYVTGFWATFVTPALLLFGGILAVVRGTRRALMTTLLLLCWVPVCAAVLQGGDYMPMGGHWSPDSRSIRC